MSAQIFPPTPPCNTPASERQMYQLFDQSPELSDWTIIHSSSHLGDHLPREIDFLALIPNHGILCIEVKGGGFYVRRGQWYRWNDHQPIESPARQSEQAMYALQKELGQVYGPKSIIGSTPAECCVIFPDTDWPISARRPRATVIDRNDIQTGQFYPKIIACVLRMRAKTGRRSRIPPTNPEVLQQILDYLVPDFDMAPSSNAEYDPAWLLRQPSGRCHKFCRDRLTNDPALERVDKQMADILPREAVHAEA